MLRGFRWQMIALLVTASLFVVTLVLRSADNPTPQPPTPIVTATQATILPTQESTLLPTAGPVLEPQTSSASIMTYREALVGSVQRLNPLFAGLNPAEADITALIFEGLFRTNDYGEPVPALAKDWVVSGDGLEYVITLRDDVLWQDGIPFNALDVLYTMSILRSPDFPGPAELGVFWRTVETEQLGEHLVRFRLTQPLGTFLSALRIGILPAHALQGTTAAQLATHPFNLSPIGTGPYQLEALRTGNSQHITAIDLRVAPVYRQRPEGQSDYALERLSFQIYDSFDVAFQALQSGSVDAYAAQNRDERALLASTSLNTYTSLEPALGAVIFNWATQGTNFFREQRVRLGLATGLERNGIVERHLSNLAARADSPLIPGSWAYTSVFWPTHDSAIALSLLESARISTPSGEEGETPVPTEPSEFIHSFNILTPDDPALVGMAQEIAAQWSQLKLQVSVEAVDMATYRQRLEAHDFDSALVELWLGADPDVYDFWDQGQYPDGKNYGGVDDRRISEVLERGRQDVNGLNRKVFYTEFQREFAQRAIAVPLYYPLFTYVTAPNIEGVQLGFIGAPSDRFRTIQNWTLIAP